MGIKYVKEDKQYFLLQTYSYYDEEIPTKVAMLKKIQAMPHIVTIHCGFTWDGPSGFVTIQTENSMRASLVHDALYTLIKEKVYPASFRKTADKILRRILRRDGMSWFRSEAWYVAVRLFGWRHVR